MDLIKFGQWTGNKLLITCYEFLNWDNHVELELDSETLKVIIKSQISVSTHWHYNNISSSLDFQYF